MRNVFVLIALLVGCAVPPPPVEPPPQPEPFELEYVAGSEAEERVGTQADGERSLFLLSISERTEDAWVFREIHAVQTWRNVGVREQPTHVSIDYTYADADRAATRIVFYHIHPAWVFFPQLAWHYRRFVPPPGQDKETAFWAVAAERHASLFRPRPSFSDFRSAASMHEIAEMLGVPSVVSKVITPLGTYTYGANRAVRRMLLKDRRRAAALWRAHGARNAALRGAGFLMQWEERDADPWPLLRDAFGRYLAETEGRGR